jgi:hypothetical protein
LKRGRQRRVDPDGREVEWQLDENEAAQPAAAIPPLLAEVKAFTREARARRIADLEAEARRLRESRPSTRASPRSGKALQTLRHSQQDADLAGLRDEKALAGLPGDERDACRRL